MKMARDLIFLKSSMFLIHGSDIVFHQDYQIDMKASLRRLSDRRVMHVKRSEL